jgi:hypothetical protein
MCEVSTWGLEQVLCVVSDLLEASAPDKRAETVA